MADSDKYNEEVDITPIDLKNYTTYSSQICDVNAVHKCYTPFLSSTN